MKNVSVVKLVSEEIWFLQQKDIQNNKNAKENETITEAQLKKVHGRKTTENVV